MPTTYKNSQVQGTAGVTNYVNLCNTQPASTAVISTIAVCNTASTSATYRIAIVPASASAAAPSASNWLVYDSTIIGYDTISLTLGVTLGQSQYVRVSSSANTVTFSAFISEIT